MSEKVEESIKPKETPPAQQQQTNTNGTTQPFQNDPQQNGEGNSEEVTIGDQTWAGQNLNTTTFRNGDPIPEAKTSEEWELANQERRPVWCYYENNAANGTKYGKIYNWYAVTDQRGLAPQGWHIPSKDAWNDLIDYLGGQDKAGHKIKDKTGWNKNGNGDNSSNFGALPGGAVAYGSMYGRTFTNLGNCITYWTSTPISSESVCAIPLCDEQKGAGVFPSPKTSGMYVRCLKGETYIKKVKQATENPATVNTNASNKQQTQNANLQLAGDIKGLVLIKDIAPGSGKTVGSKAVAIGDKAFFVVDGTKPYVTDGTEAGTISLFDSLAFVPQSKEIDNKIMRIAKDSSNNLVYFIAAAAEKALAFKDVRTAGISVYYNLWVTDGTLKGTKQIKIPNHTGAGYTVFGNVLYHRGKVYFDIYENRTFKTRWVIVGKSEPTLLCSGNGQEKLPNDFVCGTDGDPSMVDEAKKYDVKSNLDLTKEQCYQSINGKNYVFSYISERISPNTYNGKIYYLDKKTNKNIGYFTPKLNVGNRDMDKWIVSEKDELFLIVGKDLYKFTIPDKEGKIIASNVYSYSRVGNDIQIFTNPATDEFTIGKYNLNTGVYSPVKLPVRGNSITITNIDNGCLVTGQRMEKVNVDAGGGRTGYRNSMIKSTYLVDEAHQNVRLIYEDESSKFDKYAGLASAILVNFFGKPSLLMFLDEPYYLPLNP